MISKTFNWLLVTGVSAICLLDCEAQYISDITTNPTIVAAIETLKTNQIFARSRLQGFGATNKTQFEQYLKIYCEQTNAIAILASAKIPATAPILIPYLNYVTDGFQGSLMHSDFGISGQHTNVTLSLWPALGALVEIPGSGEVLANYALDKNNSIRDRLTALEALRYVDRQGLKTIADQIASEYSQSNSVISCIRVIETEDQRYMGTYVLDHILQQ